MKLKGGPHRPITTVARDVARSSLREAAKKLRGVI